MAATEDQDRQARTPDVKFLAAAGGLLVLIIIALAALWLTERQRRIRAESRQGATSLEQMIRSAGPPGAPPPSEPTRQFKVGSSGRIVVRVREGQYDVTMDFADAEQFRARQPRLFEGYRKFMDELRRPAGEAQGAGGGTSGPAATAPADGGG